MLKAGCGPQTRLTDTAKFYAFLPELPRPGLGPRQFRATEPAERRSACALQLGYRAQASCPKHLTLWVEELAPDGSIREL